MKLGYFQFIFCFFVFQSIVGIWATFKLKCWNHLLSKWETWKELCEFTVFFVLEIMRRVFVIFEFSNFNFFRNNAIIF